MKLHSQEKTLIIALLVCGLVTMIGTSFAYFTSGGTAIDGRGGSTKVTTNSDFQKVVYDAGTSTLNLIDAYPSKSADKDFTVKLTPISGANDFSYVIFLNISDNGFVKCDTSMATAQGCEANAQELVYTLTDKDSGAVLATGDLTAKTGRIDIYTVSKNVLSETTLNYNFKVEFKESDKSQNHNINKSLTSALKVEFANGD